MENIEETNTQEPQRLVCTIYNQNMYDNRPLLAALNDSGYTFEEIADIIQEHF